MAPALEDEKLEITDHENTSTKKRAHWPQNWSRPLVTVATLVVVAFQIARARRRTRQRLEAGLGGEGFATSGNGGGPPGLEGNAALQAALGLRPTGRFDFQLFFFVRCQTPRAPSANGKAGSSTICICHAASDMLIHWTFQ